LGAKGGDFEEGGQIDVGGKGALLWMGVLGSYGWGGNVLGVNCLGGGEGGEDGGRGPRKKV